MYEMGQRAHVVRVWYVNQSDVKFLFRVSALLTTLLHHFSEAGTGVVSTYVRMRVNQGFMHAVKKTLQFG